MRHDSTPPPVRIPFRQRLSYRQARTAVLLGLGVGLLLGMGEVSLDLFKERQRVHANIAQVLEVIRDAAGQATYHQDANQAEKVLTGVFHCQSIRHARLNTRSGTLLLQKERPHPETGIAKWLAALLLSQAGEITTPLILNDQPVGSLSIAVDPLLSAQDFLMRAGFTLLNNLLSAILLATILTTTFHYLLTRPILMLGQQLARLDPNAPARQPITIPSIHKADELGLLARLINRALGSFETALRVHKETERMLKQTQFSVDHAADMICWVGPDGKFLYVNEAMSHVVGYSKEELGVMSVTDINPDLTREQWTTHWNALLRDQQGRMETMVRTKRGSWLPIELHITLLKIDGQEIHCNFARDISSRKTAEMAIKRANQILLTLSRGNEAMIKAASEQELLDRICQVIVQDGGYRMVWVGYASLEADKRIRPVAQYGFDDGYLETLDISWEENEKGHGPTGTAFRTRQPVFTRQIQNDPRFTPWRQEATRRGYASSIALPLPNDHLMPLGTINIYSEQPDAFDKEEIQLLENLANNLAFGILKFREAEERRRAQKAMQLSEEKLSSLFHHSPDCLMTLDRHGVVQFTNRQGPNHPRELLTDAQIPHLQEHLASVFMTGQAVEYPFTDGESAWWEARLAPIFQEGKVSEVLAVCQDITEKRTLQAQNLRNARLASLGVLSASVAHEINNPNNAIQFNVPVLTAIWEDALPILHNAHEGTGAFYLGGMPMAEAMEVVPQLLDGIRMSSHRIQTIIGGLKHMARQDKEILTQRVNIQEPIQSALMILQNLIRQSTDHCLFTPHATPLMVKGNTQQLEQACINIIQNALQALRHRAQGVFIATGTHPDGTRLQITFRDQGRGIAPEHLDLLTNPFFTTKTASGGMGLGLSITKTIIDNHSGELLFDSEPDQGTTVTIRLPIATDQPHGEPACPTP
ncbi:MAG: PAS domain S-box protein [Magnetococcales bacterium]|nr:PAS domain S-box protein [Magnetococcales bacterium]